MIIIDSDIKKHTIELMITMVAELYIKIMHIGNLGFNLDIILQFTIKNSPPNHPSHGKGNSY